MPSAQDFAKIINHLADGGDPAAVGLGQAQAGPAGQPSAPGASTMPGFVPPSALLGYGNLPQQPGGVVPPSQPQAPQPANPSMPVLPSGVPSSIAADQRQPAPPDALQRGPEMAPAADQGPGGVGLPDLAGFRRRAEEGQADDKKQRELATQDNERAILDQRNFAQEQAARQQPLLDDLTAQISASDQRMKEIQAEAEKATQAQMMTIQAAANDAAQAQIKDFFADKSATGKVLSIISQALAGAGNALSGAPGAATPLDKLIAHDLEVQRANMAQKNAIVGQAESVMDRLQKQFGNRIQAQQAYAIAAYQKFDLASKQLATQMGTQQAQVQYEQLHAGFQAKIADIAQRASQFSTQNYLTVNGLYQQAQFQNASLRNQHAAIALRGQALLAKAGKASKADQIKLGGIQEANSLIDKLESGGETSAGATQAQLIQALNHAFTGASKAPTHEEVQLVRESMGGVHAQLPGFLGGMSYQGINKDRLRELKQELAQMKADILNGTASTPDDPQQSINVDSGDGLGGM